MPELHPPARYYADDAGEYRWRLQAANGEIVADSAEGYGEVRDAVHGLEVTARLAAEASGQVLLTAAEAGDLLELLESLPVIIRRRKVELLAALRAQHAQAVDHATMLAGTRPDSAGA